MRCKLLKRFDLKLQQISSRYKLWRISKAIGIAPYKWQRDFALNKSDSMGTAGFLRQTGKSTAVMLRILLRSNMYVEQYMFADDPDWRFDDRRRIMWFYGEYRKLCEKCAQAGIIVPVIPKLHNSRSTVVQPYKK